MHRRCRANRFHGEREREREIERERERHRERERGVPSTLKIAASVYQRYSVRPSIRPVCTRCCFTTTNMIQLCGDFHRGPVFIINTRLHEIVSGLVYLVPVFIINARPDGISRRGQHLLATFDQRKAARRGQPVQQPQQDWSGYGPWHGQATPGIRAGGAHERFRRIVSQRRRPETVSQRQRSSPGDELSQLELRERHGVGGGLSP
jgi:hypothetical protein